MSRFNKHFHMTTDDVIEYAKERLTIFDKNAHLFCEEIGDGNINYVFRVRDSVSNKSIVIKHADASTRSSFRPLDPTHNRIEASALELEAKLEPGYVPDVYYYDPVMCCICMEDLHEYNNMRNMMLLHRTYPNFAEQITTFLTETLIRTTDNIISPEEKRRLVVKYTNPELCEITERLVYTDPYNDAHGKNIIFEPNAKFVEENLYNNTVVQIEVGKLKDSFKSNCQSLVHGDMHTGSIMINSKGIKLLDPEFSCYAPAGFDIGTLIANLVFAWVNGAMTINDNEEKNHYLSWLEDAITKVIDLFNKKAEKLLKEETIERMAKFESFRKWYLKGILEDSAGSCGVELNRRIVGSAKVKDITSITNETSRLIAERTCILMANNCILNRTSKFSKGEDYVNALKHAFEEANDSIDNKSY